MKIRDIKEPQKLLDKTRKIYKKLEENGKKGLVESTIKKIIDEREWSIVARHIQENLKDVVMDNDIFYVPKGVEPGPAFVFPLRDLNDMYTRAQTKPLYTVIEDNPEVGKYWMIGDKNLFLGPAWLGNNEKALTSIVREKYVVLTEGTFDFVGSKAICPEANIISPLSKKLGRKHEAYLRMLGINKLYLMLDQDPPGIEAMETIARVWKNNFEIEIVRLPVKDASICLQNQALYNKLRNVLENIVDRHKQVDSDRIILIDEDE